VRGIVLAGGSGTRLWPVTRGISKQLVPVFDKPLIFYPISTLMLSGIREILIISTPRDISAFREVLGCGKELGINFSYAVQAKPEGIAQSLIIAESFLGGENSVLILGDNIFHGEAIGRLVSQNTSKDFAHIFAYPVKDAERYGVVEFNAENFAIRIQEKPKIPASKYAVPGLYSYPSDALEMVKTLKPSQRGELEITDLNNLYLGQSRLKVTKLPKGTAWLDTGTFESLNSASNFVRIMEERQGLKIGCLEEIAWRQGWIEDVQLSELAKRYVDSNYREYINGLIEK
jgi:glucose-1-phosphate thymidylyltransferase